VGLSMDEKLEKAFGVANYMATLTAQKNIIKEEFNQKLVHYVNGGTFKIDRELINFTKALVDLGHEEDIVFIDANQLPVVISNVSNFLDDIIAIYFEAVNEYFNKISDIKSKRKLTDIINL
jgi:hypothetical protein